MEHARNERRLYLKQLAATASSTWSKAPLPACFVGESRLETRNTVYLLRDGVCQSISRHECASNTVYRTDLLIGMRIIGWVPNNDRTITVQAEWRRGMRAVLWRARLPGEKHSVVALTSPTLAFGAASEPSLRRTSS